MLTQSQKLKQLNPEFRALLIDLLAGLEDLGWQPRIAEGLRTLKQQRAKVRKGYSSTMRSNHLTGNAADIIDRRYGWNGPASNKDFQFWKDLQEEAELLGLTSGGSWRIRDVAHVEMKR